MKLPKISGGGDGRRGFRVWPRFRVEGCLGFRVLGFSVLGFFLRPFFRLQTVFVTESPDWAGYCCYLP